ncbi:hypothetical protein BGX24_002814 [Mortierella sp. AD032]|nr:hypothetical protein BGX24_002814 [Mortierella sp. AD032]
MLTHLHKKLDTLPELAHLKASNRIHTVHHLITDESPLPEPEFSKYLAGENGGFDMVYSNYVLHHIENIQGIVDTMAKKLVKKGGWLIILDFEGHHVHGGPLDVYTDEDGKPLEFVAHKGGFTPENVADVFAKAGLVDISSTRSFGMFRDFRGTQVWTDVLVAKGRRP